MEQGDTTGAKHTDPSDITVNMCLLKSDDVLGSQVKFYGVEHLQNAVEEADSGISSPPKEFLVDQEAGYATIHWGHHPHETMPLRRGVRTNIVLTYCYRDPARSDVGNRACYFDH
jgi:hypothetical protein